MLCILCWFSLFFSITNGETVESPYTMAVFNWSNDDAVYNNSIIMAVSSSISFCIFTGFAIWGQRLKERVSITIGLCLLCGFYVATFSWPFYTGSLHQTGNLSAILLCLSRVPPSTFRNNPSPNHDLLQYDHNHSGSIRAPRMSLRMVQLHTSPSTSSLPELLSILLRWPSIQSSFHIDFVLQNYRTPSARLHAKFDDHGWQRRQDAWAYTDQVGY